MKKFNEQERYYARLNRQMDYSEATGSASAYANEVASEIVMKSEKNLLGADISDAVLEAGGVSEAWDTLLSESIVSMEMPFGDLKEIIERAYRSGVDKGRKQGGLELLFIDE
ncbi:TPA: hypothetical protein LT061_005009 [Salmonella enterica subsp. enterica serovar Blitta]|nr:hypothetical protein [Salmonella enterica subsp. enterica serovar Blitta]